MGDRHEAAHEAPRSHLPHRVGEVGTAWREFVGRTPDLLARREMRRLPPHAWGGLGWGRVRTVLDAGRIDWPLQH